MLLRVVLMLFFARVLPFRLCFAGVSFVGVAVAVGAFCPTSLRQRTREAAVFAVAFPVVRLCSFVPRSSCRLLCLYMKFCLQFFWLIKGRPVCYLCLLFFCFFHIAPRCRFCLFLFCLCLFLFCLRLFLFCLCLVLFLFLRGRFFYYC